MFANDTLPYFLVSSNSGIEVTKDGKFVPFGYGWDEGNKFLVQFVFNINRVGNSWSMGTAMIVTYLVFARGSCITMSIL